MRPLPLCRIPCVLGVSILVASAATPAPAAEDPMTACQGISNRYSAAVGSQDAPGLAALFTPDGVLNGPEGPVTGTQALTDVAAGFFKAGVLKHEDTIDGARRIGDVTLCYGAWKATFKPGSQMKEVGGRYDKVLVSNGGNWRIALLTSSYAPPSPPRESASTH